VSIAEIFRVAVRHERIVEHQVSIQKHPRRPGHQDDERKKRDDDLVPFVSQQRGGRIVPDNCFSLTRDPQARSAYQDQKRQDVDRAHLRLGCVHWGACPNTMHSVSPGSLATTNALSKASLLRAKKSITYCLGKRLGYAWYPPLTASQRCTTSSRMH